MPTPLRCGRCLLLPFCYNKWQLATVLAGSQLIKEAALDDHSIIAIIVAIVLSLCCCLTLLFLGAGVLIAPQIEGFLITPTPTPVPVVIRTPVVSAERSTEELLAETSIPERDLIALTTRLKKLDQPIPLVVNDTTPHYAVGDKEDFWVSDIDAKANYTTTATLSYVTPHLYLWVEEGSSFDPEALERSAKRFENQTYPTNREFFGSEWTPGVDNDPHIHILQASRLGASIAGYYSAADEYSKLVNPYSNEREMFYIHADRLQPGTESYDSVLAHEFQHMIHWAVDRNEDTWVNEGFSELASYLNGYDVSGAGYAFSHAPDTQLTSWPDGPGKAAANYGASFLFTTYFLERFGDQALRSVVSHQSNGTTGFKAILTEHGLTFEDVFADWLIANYLDHTELADGCYGYQGLTVGPANLDQTHTDYPVQRSTTVHQYGADYIELQGQGDLALTFTGSTQVKLVPNDPHSGEHFWWSNRGDSSNMTLTRAFDLTGLSQATLKVWLWYDIEEDWDYAYIEVSTDGGRTWDILKGQYTADSNPNGNSFGHAYTGKSGPAAETPNWVDEEIDLTPYVGQHILLRFEYVTDDAVNHVGLCVDDIAIPELDYFDEVESDEQWIAEGFIRTNNILPQRFVVQLVVLGPDVRVRRMELDEAQTGHLVVEDLGKGVERAVLVVSGLAPVTTELASYEYSIEPAQGD
jgi:immune inhibitor A